MSSPDATPSHIFHIAFLREWRAAEQDGRYRVSTRGLALEEVGYIHAGFDHQVATVGNAYYADVSEPLVVLVIEVDRLEVPVIVENPDGGDESFPHIYGALPIDAVVEVRAATVVDGRFVVEHGTNL
jgi:uncharacterized protein (DUF952 family)